MAKLTEDQMERFMKHCNHVLSKNDITVNFSIADGLNKRLQQIFIIPVLNDDMFRLNREYECCVVAGLHGLSHVDFYRVRRYKRPVKGKLHSINFSHKLPFHVFAHRNCNPWIVFELERLMFETV